MEAGEMSDANTAILPNLKRALANLTIAANIPEETGENQSVSDKYNINAERRNQYKLTGMRFLSRAVDIIKANPDNYEAYKASSLYTEPITPFENLEENQSFIFGGV